MKSGHLSNLSCSSSAGVFQEAPPCGRGASLVGLVTPPNVMVPLRNVEEALKDEVSLYNHALTAEEIKKIFDAGASGKKKPS